MLKEQKLFKKIEQDIEILAQETRKKVPGELDSKWEYLTSSEPGRFIKDDLTLDRDILRNFRKYQVFISDCPGKYGASNPLLLWSGRIRGARKLLLDSYKVIEENSYLDLLRKYPMFSAGNPTTFKYNGCEFTYRWTKHIYFLGQFNNIFGPLISKNFISIDIGSSFGIFSSLLKKEYPESIQILLDFPEQLVLAHYYIGTIFHDAKIAGFKEIIEAGKIDRSFFRQYDFILIPWYWYTDIEPGSIDMMTNFASFGEMRRQWFDYYIDTEIFKNIKYFFTSNRFQSYPTYDTDLTILDYPLHDFEKLHFGICPIFSHDYEQHHIFFYKKNYFSSQYFEFFGARQ